MIAATSWVLTIFTEIMIQHPTFVKMKVPMSSWQDVGTYVILTRRRCLCHFDEMY